MNSPKSLASTNSPIKLLHRDILWFIFNNVAESMFDQDQNTTDEEDQPQRTIRLASQVCHEWREELLLSESIWAKLIRLESLSQRRDHWRNEVVKRAGSSPLWIKAHFPSCIPGDTQFPGNPGRYFIALIAKDWARIERFDLGTRAYYKWEDMLPSMLEGSPLLRTFSFSHYGGISSSTTIDSTGEPIFANNAPKLLEFSWLNCQTHLQIHSSWTSHLQVLKINFATAHMVSQFLEVAASNCLSQLRYLKLHASTDLMKPVSYLPILAAFLPRKVDLSHLVFLELEGGHPMALFLDVILVRNECVLRVMLDDDDGPQTNDVLQTAVQRALSVYGTRHLLFRRLSTICLTVGCVCFGISVDLLDPDSSEFEIFGYGYRNETVPHFDFSLIFKDIPSAVFRNVTTLTICTADLDQTCAVEWQSPALLDLVASCCAVETLQVFAPNVSCLTSIPTHIKAFPKLLTLKLPSLLMRYPFPDPNVFNIETGLIEFCIWRRQVGFPLKVIDLTCEELFHGNLRLLSFEHLGVMEGVTLRVGQEDSPREHLVGERNFELDLLEGPFESTG